MSKTISQVSDEISRKQQEIDYYVNLCKCDENTWQDFYDDFGKRIDRFLQRKGVASPQDRDDIINETFTTVFEKLSAFDPEIGTLTNWVYGIARNVLRRHRSNYYDKKDNEVFKAIEDMEDIITDASESAVFSDKDEAITRLSSALEELSDTDQKIVMWGAVKKVSWQVIADDVGLGLSATKMRYHRALEKLRPLLSSLIV